MAVVAKQLIFDLPPEIHEQQDSDPRVAEAVAPEAVLSGEAHPSPARNLQVELEARIQGGRPLWSRRRMLALAIGFSALFWAGAVAAFLYVVAH